MKRMICLLVCLAAAATAWGEDKLHEASAEQALRKQLPEEVIFVSYVREGKPCVIALGNRAFREVLAVPKALAAHDAIAASKEFVISYPGEGQEADAVWLLTHPKDADNAIAELKLATKQGDKVAAPLLPQCIVSFECKVGGTLEAGDSTIFLGSLAAQHRGQDKARRLYITGYKDGQPVLKAFDASRPVPVPDGYEKYPEQIVMIVSRDSTGKPNVMPAGWTMRVSDDPLMVAAAVGRDNYSHRLIAGAKEMVYCYVGADMAEEVLYCGTHTGRRVDKFAAAKLATQPAKTMQTPLLAKALACLECKIVAQAIYQYGHTLFVGQVQAAWVSDKDQPRLFNLGRDESRRHVFKGLPAAEAASQPVK